ncbi:MAG TPA: hypothetical protein VGY66_19545, partial [Gemmataceae bacterium]|nr:hypothetical protein [Gemmataceae bacterium]
MLAAMAVLVTGMAFAQPASPPQKNYKNQAEYQIYNEATKDFVGNNFTKAIADLNTWKQEYPVSDYSADREVLYVKSYMGAKQYGKAVDQAGELLAQGLDKAFSDPKEGPGQMLQILYNATAAVPAVANPTSEELAIGDKVARQLMSFDRRPDGVSDADWAKLKADLQAPAKAA